jgi:D-tyrosyl-tRNA(Tyr) deacylase
MRAVVQRVLSARVLVGDRTVGEIGRGLVVFVGVQTGDGPSDVQYIATKLAELRIFEEEDSTQNTQRPQKTQLQEGVGLHDSASSADSASNRPATEGPTEGRSRMNLSVAQVGGSILVVSQFTLYGDCRRGRRPSFDRAAPPEEARDAYEAVVSALGTRGIPVATGEFQAHMRVEVAGDGPVTILLDSHKEF